MGLGVLRTPVLSPVHKGGLTLARSSTPFRLVIWPPARHDPHPYSVLFPTNDTTNLDMTIELSFSIYHQPDVQYLRRLTSLRIHLSKSCTNQSIFGLTVNMSQSSLPSPTNSAAALSFLTSVGGIIGYTRTGSIPSIAAGLSVGALYLYSFLRLRDGQPYGEEIGLLASAVLGGSSVPRVIKTRGKPVPLALSVLATYGLVVFGLAFREKRASRI